MTDIEKALAAYLGEVCGMRLRPHALTGLAQAAIAAMQPAPPQKQEGTDMNQIEKGWDELRNRCCADPTKAKRCVMVSRDDFAAAIAAMPVQAEPQWQWIESAPPPPNTRVLLAWRDWRDGKWLIEAAPYETGERVGPYSNISRHGSATHWMPLPTPPAGGSDAE